MNNVTIEIVEQPVTVSSVNDEVTVEVIEQAVTLEVGASGPQGPQGIQGPAGASGGSYVHTQNTPSTTWNVIHNLGYFPQVTVVEIGGATVEGVLTYSSANALSISFSVAISGTAYVS